MKTLNRWRLLIACVAMCFLASSVFALDERKEDADAGKEIAAFQWMVFDYMASHENRIPTNWSQIWDAKRVVSQYVYLQGRPMIFRQFAFVRPESSESVEMKAAHRKILAVGRNFISKSIQSAQSGQSQNAEFRMVIVLTDDGKFVPVTIQVGNSFLGVQVDKLVLEDPDLSPTQFADTVTQMVNSGFNAHLIRKALGDDAIRSLEKAGLLDPSLKSVSTTASPEMRLVASEKTRPLNSEKNEKTEPKPFSLLLIVFLVSVGLLLAFYFIRKFR